MTDGRGAARRIEALTADKYSPHASRRSAPPCVASPPPHLKRPPFLKAHFGRPAQIVFHSSTRAQTSRMAAAFYCQGKMDISCESSGEEAKVFSPSCHSLTLSLSLSLSHNLTPPISPPTPSPQVSRMVGMCTVAVYSLPCDPSSFQTSP